MTTIGDRLKAERKRLRLSQTYFARLGCVSLSTQKRYESAERIPDANYLAGLANIGVDMLFVITGKTTEETADENRLVMEAMGFVRDQVAQIARSACDMGRRRQAQGKENDR